MKTLTLKVGAPVVLLKNLTNQLCNGTKGVVHSIDAEDPIIKFHGKLFKINKSAFEVFDTRQNKVRATRIQYPLKLGFCLTVHKAQGRTEPYLEVDCYNFFAPGQLGVAIGRAVSLENLRVRNYSPDCANIKHLPHVYDFYESCNQKDNLFQDMSCCHSAFQDEQQILETNLSGNSEPPNAVNPWAGADVLNQATSQLSCSDDVMFDLSDCPPPAGIHVDNERLLEFAGSIESKLCTILPRDGQSKDAWASAFRLFHTYLLSNEYKQLLIKLFQTGTVSPAGNRYATKLAFGVHHALVASRAEAIKGRMDTAGKYNVEQPLSDIAKAKIRYIAGACLSRVTTRLRSRALSDITNKMHSATRKHAYAQQRLLTGLRVSEQHIIASTSEPASLSEIDNKQSATRGLFHVPDKVFSFFTKLHSTAQRYLSPSQFDEHQEKTFTACRDRVFGDPQLLVLWSDLFPVEDSCTDQDNELAQALVHELYNQVSEHYLRVCFVDALHEVKEKLPKTKKQALRSKIEGATKIKVAIKPETKRKKEMQEILCPICNQVCVEMPQSRSENSIQCDGCNEWFHTLCAKVGSTKKIKKWFCSNCTKSR